jgi:hypothetical protein
MRQRGAHLLPKQVLKYPKSVHFQLLSFQSFTRAMLDGVDWDGIEGICHPQFYLQRWIHGK